MAYYNCNDVTEMSWDEYRLAVEDELLMETGELPADGDMLDIYAAFDAGMPPWRCASSICPAYLA